jgi:membrane-associated phospholipid phosphatase
LDLLQFDMILRLPAGIRHMDYYLFSLVNGKWHTSFLDELVPFIREPTFWVPFYFFLATFAVINFKRKGWYWVLTFAVTAISSDFISSRLIKGTFFRVRPCHNMYLASSIRFLVSYCPESSSFTSSHAVNHFTAAMFIFTTFKDTLSRKWGLIFLWAFAVAYAQVYVGVHFPFDVFCGSLVGLVIGYIPAKIFNNKIGLLKR